MAPRTKAAESNQHPLQSLAHLRQGRTRSFFESRLLKAQKSVGQRDQRDVVMPTEPMTAFEVGQPEFFFQLAVVHFDPPTRMTHSHQTTQTGPIGTQLMP